jgi:hypothetical protein
MATQDFEKLGAFYLGRAYDLGRAKLAEELVLYDSKDLTTHGVCVGMTGSGKTGLCLTLLEEAAIDGIPVLAIDPKGDIANLLLSFPELRAADFAPWLDQGEVEGQGTTREELAEQTAGAWREGLLQWGQDGARIARFRAACELAIYTPGSQAGLPLSLLRSFAAPAPSVLDDAEALREKIQSTVSGLLGLIGVEADPLKSREHILLSQILHGAWGGGHSLDLAGLIQAVQKPPFERVGVFELESFFPSKERFELALALNNLLASPAGMALSQGEPLDIPRLLYGPSGKPRISILSIAHLSDAQRMFFVATLLGEVIAWMRAQGGTSSLRAILYMDEIFGYFPPTAVPPSKPPMLTLLKQARAFGLGILLATQNPVDLDYKGLSNCGTWFIGRLQTERDKDRVLDGLEGASAAAGHAFDRQTMDRVLSGLQTRVFLMNNVHESGPVVFQTRWTMSFLRGPIARDEIKRLMDPLRGAEPSRTGSPLGASQVLAQAAAAPAARAAGAHRPVLPPDVRELFWPVLASPDTAALYRPSLLAHAKVHYANAKAGVDYWEKLPLLIPLTAAGEPELEQASPMHDEVVARFASEPAAGVPLAETPATLTRDGKYADWKKAIATFLYQHRRIVLYSCRAMKLKSTAGEDLAAFRARVDLAAREARDGKIEALRKKYTPKVDALRARIARGRAAVAREQEQVAQATMGAAISFGAGLLGAFTGRRVVSAGNVGRAGAAARSSARVSKEKRDAAMAADSLVELEAKLAALESEFTGELQAIGSAFDPQALIVEEVPIAPRKADIAVDAIACAWMP